MPKIRLSALATDMKGKAGGSVFSTNAGGVYFRNNPSGTSSKKPSNGLRRQLFATLAQSWKQLTEEEMAAWADAGPLYPTTNAWGESRIPKGFELYMRLNMNLVSVGLPTLLLPLTPRSIPTITSGEITWTDEFQLIPTSFFACQALNDTTVYNNPKILNYLTAATLTTDTFISFRTNIRPSVNGSPFNPGTIDLLSILDGSSLGFQMSILDLNTHLPYIRVRFDCVAGGLVRDYDISNLRLDTDFHIGYQLQASGFEDGFLYVNGQALTPTDTITGVLTADVLTASLKLWPDTNSLGYQILFSDFRIYNSVLPSTKASDISYGYVFTDEYILIPMNILSGDQLVNYTTPGDAQPMTIVDYPPLTTVVSPYNPRLLPNLTVEMTGTEEADYHLKFLITQFVSVGKNYVSNNFKLAELLVWSDAVVYNPQDGMAKLLYSTMANSSLWLKVQAIDRTTGAVGVELECKPKHPRKRLFKAGAELSGKVN